MRAPTLIATLVLLTAITNLYSYSVEADEQINVWFANGVLNDVLGELAQQYTNQYPDISVKLVGLPYEELKTSMVRAVQKKRGAGHCDSYL
jgi:ABC-type glycerol-3-phosphate transport system substrate-binding protein